MSSELYKIVFNTLTNGGVISFTRQDDAIRINGSDNPKIIEIIEKEFYKEYSEEIEISEPRLSSVVKKIFN